MSEAIQFSSSDPWFAAMQDGDFMRAWHISDRHLQERLAGGGPWLHHIWRGDRIAGKRVLVRCHHGLGDTIQFIRFAQPLRNFAREVIVWVQPEIMSLVAGVAGVDRVFALHPGEPTIECDTELEVMELGHVLRADTAMIRGTSPYLSFDRGRDFSRYRKRAVGLVWRAGEWAPQRSVPPELFSLLTRIPGVQLISLQRGAAAADAARVPALDASVDDAGETAATLLGLDLLITVDTFAAHLAGALGLRTWLLLQHQCDWRWQRNGTDSIWYPSMTLFRQQQPGDWRAVIERIATKLSTEQ